MMNSGKMYGYARVSSKEQNLDRQMDALQSFGVEKNAIFMDKASGCDFKRPAYRRLMRHLHEEDVLVIKSIDRLGRNYEEILEEWKRITVTKGAAVVVIDMPLLDTREQADGLTGKFIADLVLQLLSYVAQIERENIRQRQAEGIAAALARGVHFGRPKIERPEIYDKIKKDFQAGLINRTEAALELNVSTSTFDNWRRQDRARDSLSAKR